MQQGMLLAGRYRIGTGLGTGGMGTVYAAHDERLGRDVAVKLLRADLAADPKAHARFLNEAQIAAQVVHPNIVRTYDFGDDPAGPFLVQELLQGRPLDQALPLLPPRAVPIVDGIAAALGALHEQGYVHCDVKPQNIWLRPDDTPVLLDFGVARAEGTDVTTLIATPYYLAPERAAGSPPTASADLYALGVVFYQMLTGRVPFTSPSIHEVLAAHRDTPVPPLGIAEDLAPALDRIIARLMAKNLDDRYPSVEALRHDLATLRPGSLPATPVHSQPTLVVPPQNIAPPLTVALPASPVEAMAAPRRRTNLHWLPLLLIPLLGLAGFGIMQQRRVATEQPALPAVAPSQVATSAVEAATNSPTAPTLTATTLDVLPVATVVPINGAPTLVEAQNNDNTSPAQNPPASPDNGKEKDKGKGKNEGKGNGKDK